MTGAHSDATKLAQVRREPRLLSNLFKRSHIVAFRWANQPGWPVQHVSPTIERFGYQAEDFISGHTLFSSLIHPDDIEDIRREVLTHIAQGPDEYRQTYRLRHGQGHWIWVDDFTWLIRNENGVVTDICGVLLNITPREQLEREHKLQASLRHSERRFRELLEHLPNVAVQGYDKNRRVIFWNHGSEVTYGYSASEAMGRDRLDLLVPQEQRAHHAPLIERLLTGESAVAPVETEMCDKQGARKTVFSSLILRRSPNDEPEFYCIDVDLTTQKQAQQRLELLAQVFSHSHDGVVITNAHAMVIEVNDRYCEMTGYHRDELLGKMPSMLDSGYYDKSFYTSMWTQLDAQGYWVGELWNRKKSGEPYPVEIRITPLKNSDGAAVNYIAHVTDITERLNYEQKLRHVAFYDPLTGLPNRSSLSDTLHQAVARFKYRNVPFAVVFIDLDEFKAINDANGHEIGDRYLQGVGQRLQSIIREGDTAARFGGDEFVLILQNQHADAPAPPAFNRLMGAMRDPIVIEGKPLKLAASFGVTFYPQDSEVDADQLLRQADQAMYSAKQRGKNQIVYFDAELERSIMIRNTRIVELRRAIDNGEMRLHYQPQVDMSTGQVLGVEALVRWNHPSVGLLAPATFLDLTQEHEQLGLFLSKWVLSQALSDLERIRSQGHHLRLSVNSIIPSQENLRTVFLNDLRETLQQHANIAPPLLTLEMVENTLINDLSEATRTIAQVQQMGVQISLDDFGTGFSSLSHLKHLPFDELKIDQTFVQDMLNDRDDMTIVQAVVSLSRSFDVSVIGEGVETARHAEMLLRLGCVKAQGYAISRPLSVEALETWLENWQPDPAWQHIVPIAPHFYQLVANLSGYTGWLAALEQYLHGHILDAPDWNFRTRDLTTHLQSNIETRNLWHQAQAYERTLHEAGTAAIRAFQQTGCASASKPHMERAIIAFEGLQTLVWSRLVEPMQS